LVCVCVPAVCLAGSL